jgi:hypothetical protein
VGDVIVGNELGIWCVWYSWGKLGCIQHSHRDKEKRRETRERRASPTGGCGSALSEGVASTCGAFDPAGR